MRITHYLCFSFKKSVSPAFVCFVELDTRLSTDKLTSNFSSVLNNDPGSSHSFLSFDNFAFTFWLTNTHFGFMIAVRHYSWVDQLERTARTCKSQGLAREPNLCIQTSKKRRTTLKSAPLFTNDIRCHSLILNASNMSEQYFSSSIYLFHTDITVKLFLVFLVLYYWNHQG